MGHADEPRIVTLPALRTARFSRLVNLLFTGEKTPNELPVAEAVAFTGVRLMGHQHVSDACLLGLAIRQGGVLATLDQRIAVLTEPKSAERKSLETVG